MDNAIVFNVYGDTIGKGALSKSALTLKSLKKNIKKIIIDHPIQCVWIYYEHFDEMIKRFETFDFVDEICDVGLCWEIFSMRFVTNTWNTFTKDDFTETEILISDSNMEKYPCLDQWNCSYIVRYQILRNRSKEYYDLWERLNNARYDDKMQSRTETEWGLIYQYRFDLLVKGDEMAYYELCILQTTEENMFYNSHARSAENARFEFFPRKESIPISQYATFNYWVKRGLKI